MKVVATVWLSLGLLFAAALTAKEFRTINPISVPDRVPQGAIAIKRIAPVSGAAVTRAVEQLMASWSTPQLEELINERFYDKDRLLDNIAAFVPRDARVRILAIQSADTVAQYILPSKTDPKSATRVSKVVVVVSTAVEFTDANGQFQSLEGVNEYTFEIKQELRRK
ncbi:MAG: hypothetical protein ACWA5Q_09140 [bacterium]